MRPNFILFGPAHLSVIALAVLVPPVLWLCARARPGLDRPFRLSLAALLAGGWIGWYALSFVRGWISLQTGLPLNLCDWAAAALVVALIHPNQYAYELGYFWGLGGTLQGLITPEVSYKFPDPQFVFFFINHSGIVAALLYLSLMGCRPYPSSLLRVAAVTVFYVGVAGLADFLLPVNYGFLAAKPITASIMDLLSPWPWYIPELVVVGILSLMIYYIPFAAMDAFRRARITVSA